MTAHELVADLYRQGFNLAPLPGGKLEVRPASKLTPELRQELKQHKAEILPLLDAVTWLRAQLNIPGRIAPIIAEWVGERDGISGRWIDDLMAARWTLGVEAYAGEDGRMWWRVPQTYVQ
jgi:TubC N-terminal docking domain